MRFFLSMLLLCLAAPLWAEPVDQPVEAPPMVEMTGTEPSSAGEGVPELPAPPVAPAEPVPPPADTAPSGAAAEAPSAAAPQPAGETGEEAALDRRVQDLKRDVIELNRDLLVLEEALLFPSNTQLAVFVSMDVGVFFKLDSVQLKIDDKIVNNYLYTAREVDALSRGGVQRLHLGNVTSGRHELVAFFVGLGPDGREYRRGVTHVFDKAVDTKYLELKISDDKSAQQPRFLVREW